MRTASLTAAGELAVKADSGAVAIHGREQNLARAALFRLLGPFHRVPPGRLSAAMSVNFESRPFTRLASIATIAACDPKRCAIAVDQRRVARWPRS